MHAPFVVKRVARAELGRDAAEAALTGDRHGAVGTRPCLFIIEPEARRDVEPVRRMPRQVSEYCIGIDRLLRNLTDQRGPPLEIETLPVYANHIVERVAEFRIGSDTQFLAECRLVLGRLKTERGAVELTVLIAG